MSRCKSTKMVDWSALPEELLTQVAGRLPSLADRFRFGGVCSSWRSASDGTRPRARPGLPFLVLLDEACCSLFDAANQKVCGTLEFPRQVRPTSEPMKVKELWSWLGSCHSWFGFVSDRGAVGLLNPLTGKGIRLASLGNDCAPLRPQRLCMSSPDPSDPNCVVMAIYCGITYPKYTRAVCGRWSDLERHWWLDGVEDMVFHEGKFYALCFSYRLGHGVLAVVDVGDRRDGDPGPNRVSFITALMSAPCPAPSSEYLVGFPGGELVLVLRKPTEGSGESRTVTFVVMKVDISGRRPAVWEKVVGSLGGRSIFVGPNCSASISALEASEAGYRENCIYFTDARDGAGVFEVQDGGVVGPLYDSGGLQLKTPAWSMWFVPNPRTACM